MSLRRRRPAGSGGRLPGARRLTARAAPALFAGVVAAFAPPAAASVGAAAVSAAAARDAPPAAGGAAYQPLVAVVHLHTSLADGAATPLELARAARAAGVDALIVTDHLLERISYAPWPIGGVLGVTWSRPSVVRAGVARYLRTIGEAEAAVPGTIVVPGVEVTPHARWSGSPLARTLTLHGWHRHALVVGIEDAGRLLRLPAAGNRRGGEYGPRSLAFVLPAAVLVWAAARCARPGFRRVHLASFTLRRRRVPWSALLAGGAALACLVAGWPYRVERFPPAGPDPGAGPHRAFAAAVRDAGGVLIWAHPEAASRETLRGVRVETEPYPHLVRDTDATLFAALPQGTRVLLPPGGVWDQALGDYLGGRRPDPLFALAELDEHAAAPAIDFRLLQSVFLARGRSRADLLEALRAGRFYGRWTPRGAEPLRLEAWSVERPARGGQPAAAAIAGETLAASGPLLVRWSVTGGGPPVTLRLVRDGAVVWTDRRAPPLAGAAWAVVERPAFFRLDVEGPYPCRLIANPIFVVPGGAA